MATIGGQEVDLRVSVARAAAQQLHQVGVESAYPQLQPCVSTYSGNITLIAQSPVPAIALHVRVQGVVLDSLNGRPGAFGYCIVFLFWP